MWGLGEGEKRGFWGLNLFEDLCKPAIVMNGEING